jgi:hypothetical protein
MQKALPAVCLPFTHRFPSGDLQKSLIEIYLFSGLMTLLN